PYTTLFRSISLATREARLGEVAEVGAVPRAGLAQGVDRRHLGVGFPKHVGRGLQVNLLRVPSVDAAEQVLGNLVELSGCAVGAGPAVPLVRGLLALEHPASGLVVHLAVDVEALLAQGPGVPVELGVEVQVQL